MKIKNLLTKTLLVAAGLLVGASNAWATEWSTVWTTDFASAPSGMTYSISAGTMDISNGYLRYYNNSGSGTRTTTAVFSDSKFNVATDWKMEFDWNCGLSNNVSSSVVFSTNEGAAFTISWANNGSTASVLDASSNSLTTTLPPAGYNIGTCSTWSHITIIGDADAGIYLTITNDETTYVNNVLVTSTFGYPASFNGSLGKSVSSMFIDNITFATPKVAGFVNAPTGTITAPDGTSRKFTLSCLTADVTMYYSETELAVGDAGWTTYTGETTTDAATIYAYAKDGDDNVSAVSSFATGAGTAITLNAPTITLSGVAVNAGVYYPIVTIASDQSSLDIVPASPTLTYTLDDAAIASSSPYTFTGTGTLKVTISADGYTSNEASYTVSTGYAKTKTIDLTAVAAGDLSAVWTYEAESALPKGSTTYPQYVYDYRNESASSTDVIDGLTFAISSKTADPGVTPTMYIGAGLILPDKKRNLSDLSASSTWNTSIGVGVNGGTSDQIAVYYYDSNYNANHLTSTITADGTYWLYRYSDMLTKVEVYSPAESVTVSSAGYATYVSTNDLDFSATTIKAYTAKVNTSTGVITLTKVDNVPAGTPVLLYVDGGKTESIPTMTGAATVGDNDLVAGTGATVATTDGAGNYNYILNNVSGIGFYKANGQTVATNRAYLQTTYNVASGARMMMVFADEDMQTTGISDVRSKTEDVKGNFFDLSGRRVAQPTKGLYIVNGKKVVLVP